MLVNDLWHASDSEWSQAKVAAKMVALSSHFSEVDDMPDEHCEKMGQVFKNSLTPFYVPLSFAIICVDQSLEGFQSRISVCLV